MIQKLRSEERRKNIGETRDKVEKAESRFRQTWAVVSDLPDTSQVIWLQSPNLSVFTTDEMRLMSFTRLLT